MKTLSSYYVFPYAHKSRGSGCRVNRSYVRVVTTNEDICDVGTEI